MARTLRVTWCTLVLALVVAAAVSIGATSTPSVSACPNQCSGANGACDAGVCKCRPGYSGADCSQACPGLCSQRGVCADGKCLCKPGFGGEDCSEANTCPRSKSDHPDQDCSSHGVCDRPTGQCVCRQGYVGKDCSIDDGSCGSQHCSNHGHCSSGQCQCDLGYSGEHCEVKATCPSDCAGAGLCIGGVCNCYPGFSGSDCKTKDASTCPGENGGCNGNGVCVQGKCVCSIGFEGKDCKSTSANTVNTFCSGGNNCNNHGVCANNQCFCHPGFFGRKCEKQGCAKGCSDHGFCSMGVCRCQPGWGGADCSKKSECPNGCSNHGVCTKGVCSCDPYYAGEDCSKITLPSLPCPENLAGKECSGNGFCFLGQCFCEASFKGAACGETVQNCPGNCGGPMKGTCRFGQCFCEPGYEGSDCSTVKTCPKGCEKRGICLKGECKCALGYEGKDCSVKVSAEARQSALERDLLNSVAAQAAATPSAASKAKALAKAKKDGTSLANLAGERQECGTSGKPCGEHGLCVGSTCVCEAGWGGAQCTLVMHSASSTSCAPGGCQNGGECLFGSCVCLPGFSGLTCSESSFLPCPSDCHNQGICYLGACECHPGFEGDDCGKVKGCEKDGCVHGACVQGTCECVWGFIGKNCSEAVPESQLGEKDYLSTEGLNTCGTLGCGSHGVCMAHQCVCVEGYAGQLCDVPLAGYVARPSTEPTPANPLVSDIFGTQPCEINCGLHGVCVGGSCSCVDGWADAKCTTSVPALHSASKYGVASDFLAIMTQQKRARVVVAAADANKAAAARTTAAEKLAKAEAARARRKAENLQRKKNASSSATSKANKSKASKANREAKEARERSRKAAEALAASKKAATDAVAQAKAAGTLEEREAALTKARQAEQDQKEAQADAARAKLDAAKKKQAAKSAGGVPWDKKSFDEKMDLAQSDAKSMKAKPEVELIEVAFEGGEDEHLVMLEMESIVDAEADSEDDDQMPIVQMPTLHRQTALLTPGQEQLKQHYSPDASDSMGSDAEVTAHAPNQVEMNQAQAVDNGAVYHMSVNPWLMVTMCFLAGALVTIAMKCLLDKRDQEKRKMKKMEELLQPAL